MAPLATTKMSSKGQVVIPETIRKRLGLKPGSQFVVVGGSNVVILKTIAPPSTEEFKPLMREAKRRAREAGMKPADIASAVRKVRGRR